MRQEIVFIVVAEAVFGVIVLVLLLFQIFSRQRIKKERDTLKIKNEHLIQVRNEKSNLILEIIGINLGSEFKLSFPSLRYLRYTFKDDEIHYHLTLAPNAYHRRGATERELQSYLDELTRHLGLKYKFKLEWVKPELSGGEEHDS